MNENFKVSPHCTRKSSLHYVTMGYTDYCHQVSLTLLGFYIYTHTSTHAFMYMKVKVKSLSHVRLFATPWTAAYQAPPSMGFSRQECWSGLPFPSPGNLLDPGIEPGSPALQVDSLPTSCEGSPVTYLSYSINK